MASKFTRKQVKSSPGGEVYAFSEMMDHATLLRKFCASFVDFSLAMVGLEDGKTGRTTKKVSKAASSTDGVIGGEGENRRPGYWLRTVKEY